MYPLFVADSLLFFLVLEKLASIEDEQEAKAAIGRQCDENIASIILFFACLLSDNFERQRYDENSSL